MADPKNRRYIAALDIGTTTIKCHIYTRRTRTIGRATTKVDLLTPQPGYFEINPNVLWESVLSVMNEAMRNASITAADLICLGISSQRCSFITWNKIDDVPFHNFITWKDSRAKDLIEQINESPSLRMLRMGAAMGHKLTRSTKLLLGSKFRFVNAQVAGRLAWMLQNNPLMAEAMHNNNLFYGTIETYLIYKFTLGKKHITDMSSASATGLFDPFDLNWSKWILYLLKISPTILPNLVETCGSHFGHVHRSFFGYSIPISASVADQSAAMFGNLCFTEGEMKFTLGTGTFLNANTGRYPIGSVEGLYPVIGWKYKNELVYLAEVSSNDTSALVDWIVKLNLTTDIQLTAKTAFNLHYHETDRKCTPFFVPAFNGLQVPVNDPSVGCGFIGVTANTRSDHLIKSILESIAFTCAEMYDLALRILPFKPQYIKIDGGVSNNDYICKCLADVVDVPIIKQIDPEATLLGTAYLAALGADIWTTQEDLLALVKPSLTYEPDFCKAVIQETRKSFEVWREAVNRFRSWHP